MNLETRVIPLNLRSKEIGENDDPIIEGYFSLFNDETELFPNFFEKIDVGAFDRTLKESDVRALINHDTGLVLGRTSTGTLELETDDKGLRGIIHINKNDTEAMNLYARVQRGDVSQCSFGFCIRDQKESFDGDVTRVTLTDIDLFEVSCVTFPAYENTSIEARDKMNSRYKFLDKQNKLMQKFRGLIQND